MNLILPESGLLFWMTLVFAIVFFILAKFGFPVITRSVRKREEFIADSLKKAEEVQESYARMEQERQRMLEETSEQQNRMLEEAREASARIVEQARERATKEAEQMLERANDEIRLQRKEAMQQLHNTVVEMSVAVAEKVLRRQLDNKDAQMTYIEDWVEQQQDGRTDAS